LPHCTRGPPAHCARRYCPPRDPTEQKQALIDVNASGLVHTFDAALPFLRRAAPGAHAVAMASTSAEYGSPHHALYSATKFFVRGYTEALAVRAPSQRHQGQRQLRLVREHGHGDRGQLPAAPIYARLTGI